MAKTVEVAALAAPSAALSTVTRPATLSATKTSPFGATRTTRGSLRPEANKLTAKPSSAFGQAPSGRATTHDGLAAERDAPGAGRSASVSLRRTPGASLRQSP
jgi:hypothetical protein